MIFGLNIWGDKEKIDRAELDSIESMYADTLPGDRFLLTQKNPFAEPKIVKILEKREGWLRYHDDGAFTEWHLPAKEFFKDFKKMEKS